jgi:hypothetical protein
MQRFTRSHCLLTTATKDEASSILGIPNAETAAFLGGAPEIFPSPAPPIV